MKRSFKNLLLEPYRPFFFVGSLMAILMQAHWFGVLLAKQNGTLTLNLTRPIYQIHGHEMLYCTFAYFAFGFLLTAYPRFVEVSHPKSRLVLLWVGGIFLAEFFLWMGQRNAAWFYLSTALEMAVYGSVLFFLMRCFRVSKTGWREQPRLILLGLFFGLLGAFLGDLALIRPEWVALRAFSIQIGLYGFIILLVFSITWRVVPFFSSRVIPGYEMKRGRYIGKIVFGLIVMRLGLAGVPVIFPDLQLIPDLWCWTVDTGLMLALLSEILRWRPWRARVFPPLFVLYLGLFWLLVYLALSPLHLVARYSLPALDTFLLVHERNLLHIFNIGTFGTLILAVAGRVTRGHGGLPLRFDGWMGLALLLMQAAMVVRVVNVQNTMHYAALLWVLAFSLWAGRHLHILLQVPQGPET